MDRISEIEAQAAEDGLALPYPAAVIAQIEERGGMVDLTSGRILWNGTEHPVMLYPAAEARTWARLEDVEVLPGLELSLLPWENAIEIGSQLQAFFDEVERRPGMADELTDGEAERLGLIG